MNSFLRIIHNAFAKSPVKSIEERYQYHNLKLVLSTNKYNKPAALATRINKFNSEVVVFNYYFSSIESREKYLTNHIESLERAAKSKKQKADRKKEVRADFVNPFKVDDIFVDSWGYDQTNVNFYQVVEVKAKSVVLREISYEQIEATGPMSAEVSPIKDDFCSEPFLKNVVFYLNAKNEPVYYLKSQFGSMSKHVAGQTHYKSWYA